MTDIPKVFYPNQPLVEVVFELRFPGEMAVECDRHIFWEKVRADYSAIFVPTAEPNKPFAHQPYRFERADKTAGISITINSFALYVRQYEGYIAFRDEFLKLLQLFTETFHVEKVNRAGWRYINIIPYVRENGVIPLARFLNLGVKVPTSIPENFTNLTLLFESKTDQGTVTTRLQSVTRPDSGQEALLLDFDFGCEGDNLEFAEVPQYMEVAHEYTSGLFEALITEEYRTYLKGDVL